MVHQALLTVGFPRQEYWGGLLFPSPGDLRKPGIEPSSSALAGTWEVAGRGKARNNLIRLFTYLKESCCFSLASNGRLIFHK